MFRLLLATLVVGSFTVAVGLPTSRSAAQEKGQPELKALPVGEFPPGWLPIDRLDDKAEWKTYRKTIERPMLYLPPDTKSVRGVFVCYVFHSGDPRELARLWNFALVLVPVEFEYDVGFYDRRNLRPKKTGLKVGNMGVVLDYLATAAKELKRPELATVPIVGWMGQNGAHICGDLFKRAPERVLAWGDAWYGDWKKHPELVASVPVASAWELDEKPRVALRNEKLAGVENKPTPPSILQCNASTYGFKHGIYSKYNFFMSYLDRCIKVRMPDAMPEPGQPVKLKPIDLKAGWAGDFNEIGQWVAIAPVAEAKGMVDPTWLPDPYAAWMWRSYHSAKPDIKLTGPAVEYRSGGAPECGLGYGKALKAETPQTFTADAPATYAKVEFHDGDKVVGTADAAPWKAEGVKLERGLRAIFAVGVTKDGQRTASRPAFVIVE